MKVIITLISGILLGLLLSPVAQKEYTIELTKLDEVMRLIEHNYVDPLNDDTLSDQMLRTMLTTLDPHSRYSTKEEQEQEATLTKGSFDGIGVLLHYKGDTVCVNEITPGGPSVGTGLQPGDRILKVDTTVLSGVNLSHDEVLKHLRGPRGTRANLTIKRPGEEGSRHIQIVRNSISSPSVSYYGMLDGTTGYIMLNRFCETSAEEFHQALASLKQQGMKQLIFDLRENAGGLLGAVIDIANELIPEGQQIVYTEGEHQRRRNVVSKPGGLFTEGKLVVLINEFSASGSEIIAGTVQDNDRGLIVGRRSFGKGLVQSPFTLKDGSVVYLTTARYYTPSGRCIQRPYNKGTDEYYMDFLRQTLDSRSDTILTRPTDTTRYFTTQGRVVYAGGGILPDKPLPLFTDSLLAYYNTLKNCGVFADYAFDYISLHYADLHKRYPSEDSFVSQFQASDAMLQAVVALGKERGIQPNAATLKRYGAEMRDCIKAYLGQSLFSTMTYTRIMLQYDEELKKARKY